MDFNSALRKFDPGELRDQHGRWASAGAAFAAWLSQDTVKTALGVAFFAGAIATVGSAGIAAGVILEEAARQYAEYHQITLRSAFTKIGSVIDNLIALRHSQIAKADDQVLQFLLALKAALPVHKYDPNEARDERGRWTAGSGITVLGKPSASFMRELSSTYDAMPQDVRQALQTNSPPVVVEATDKFTTAYPGTASLGAPPGWPPGTTFNDLTGGFNTDTFKLVMAEQGLTSGYSAPMADVLFHETGHAIDSIFGLSNNAAISSAYSSDLRNISALRNYAGYSSLSYFTQPGFRGLKETIGELFANTYGHASSQSGSITRFFPYTYEAMGKALSGKLPSFDAVGKSVPPSKLGVIFGGQVGDWLVDGFAPPILGNALDPVRSNLMTTKKLSANASVKDWIDDFQASDDPRFKGKSQAERRRMAIAAAMSHGGVGKSELMLFRETFNRMFKSFDHVLKDLDVGDVHATTALGNQKPKRRKLPKGVIEKYSPDEARNQRGEWATGGSVVGHMTPGEASRLAAKGAAQALINANTSWEASAFGRDFLQSVEDDINFQPTSVGGYSTRGLANSMGKADVRQHLATMVAYAASRKGDPTWDGLHARGKDLMAKLGIPLVVTKTIPEKQMLFGWASVVEKDGRLVVDKQNDIILPEDLEAAAYDYCLNVQAPLTPYDIEKRSMGDMHSRMNVGRMIESMVFTKDKQNALGIDLGQVGWWVGFKVDDPDVWAAYKRGERPEFSIGGSGVREDYEIAKRRVAAKLFDELIVKFNHNHDQRGRFATSPGGASALSVKAHEMWRWLHTPEGHSAVLDVVMAAGAGIAAEVGANYLSDFILNLTTFNNDFTGGVVQWAIGGLGHLLGYGVAKSALSASVASLIGVRRRWINDHMHMAHKADTGDWILNRLLELQAAIDAYDPKQLYTLPTDVKQQLDAGLKAIQGTSMKRAILFEEALKYNHNHDAKGRFASAPGDASAHEQSLIHRATAWSPTLHTIVHHPVASVEHWLATHSTKEAIIRSLTDTAFEISVGTALGFAAHFIMHNLGLEALTVATTFKVGLHDLAHVVGLDTDVMSEWLQDAVVNLITQHTNESSSSANKAEPWPPEVIDALNRLLQQLKDYRASQGYTDKRNA